jgi:NADH-quinone oxidoreductase subunit J
VTQVEVYFWIFAVGAVGSALLCITRKSPVASALWLVGTMFSLAAIFVLLDAQFIAAIQVLVYAGAIMVLFLFVIMLLNLGRSGPSDRLGWVGGTVMFAIAGVLMSQLWVLGRLAPPEMLVQTAESVAAAAEEQGAVGMISEPLFRVFLVPFEITSVLLLAAIVGAVVLAKRRL